MNLTPTADKPLKYGCIEWEDIVVSLDTNGTATASWTLPSVSSASLIGTTLWQAYIVYHDAGGKDVFDMASNAVPITLVN
jgi:hypothetical protein